MVRSIQAVIFDMDGVLIDSEPVYLGMQARNLHARYPWVTVESMYPTVGMSSQEYPRFMAQLCRVEQTPEFENELLLADKNKPIYYPDILRPEVRPMLEELQAMGLQLALASSSPMHNIRQVLGECGLTEFFSVIVSGEQFEKSKPDPEIYLHTMEQLGRCSEECLIVEDSTYGVKAGAAAGGTVAALRDDRFPFDQSPAQLHIESLREVPALAACGGKKIRAAFFDIDGTLISMGGHKMPASLPGALDTLRKNGAALLLGTGRHPLEIEQENLLPGLQFDGAAYMNGQLCEWQGKPVVQNLIPPQELAALHAYLDKTGRSCIFLERNDMYANKVDDRLIEGQAHVGTAVPPLRSLDGLETREIYQVIPYVDAQEERELLTVMPNCKTLRWGDAVVDLTTKAGGKEKGIRALCNAMGISVEETIAFGDGANDMEMLEMAGIGVAMGNALEETKRCADYVTDDVDDDGLAKALRHFHLI